MVTNSSAGSATAFNDGKGTLLTPKSGPATLAHELGHQAGYDEGDHKDKNNKVDKAHNKDKKNIMYFQNVNTRIYPDKCWCEKMSEMINGK